MQAWQAAALAITLATSTWLATPSPASACGSFFCGRQPVDQNAERIVYALDQDSTTMIVQLQFMGDAEDFAWVLPLGEVPDPDSLDTFPQQALTMLDANTAPVFSGGCAVPELAAQAGTDDSAPAPTADGAEPPVTVHVRQDVGPYDVAVIESRDYTALIDWLVAEQYRVTEPMHPYIRTYTDEGMKFLALKLQPDQETSDIQPFRFTVPGTTPMIPLRMTALAAEPEMGILVTILGEHRYGPRDWPELSIDDDDLVWDPNSGWPLKTNYTALVAKAVDEAGGEGWVTELAGPSQQFLELARNSPAPDMETQQWLEAVIGLLEGRPYITRLYSRMSAEEMTSDPYFERYQDDSEVSRVHQLPYDQELCDVPPPPCDFVTCGAGGICREVMDDQGNMVTGCGCVPGATARTTFDASGEPTVVCQDTRMSFVNPGDVQEGVTLGDPCDGFDCGAEGTCLAVNMTPTCVCNEGFVAVGTIEENGQRQTRCTQPMESVPADFYQKRLPDLPAVLPGGRAMPDVMPAPTGTTGSGTSRAGTGSAGSGGDESPSDASSPAASGGEPSPIDLSGDLSGDSAAGSDGDGGCAVTGAASSGNPLPWLLAAAALAWRWRRRRSVP